nr:MAG TPA: PolyVal ADP-Ribosyltransferase [Ackermannviridae sp.]
MTKNFNTARSEYKRKLENLISSQAQAEVQNAGTRGQNAMNQTASTVSAQIDPGKIDGVKYAETLAQGIAEIKAAQQKQLEKQLEQQAKEIAARQKAAAKANAKAEKKQEQAEQSVQTEQDVQDDENTAKGGKWTPWGEQSPVVGPVRSGSMKKPSEETAAADGTKEKKKSLWQKIGEWGRSESPAEQQLHEELHQKAAEAKQAQADEKAKKVAELKALNRSQAKARAESRAMRETNAGLLNKEKLTEAEKEEIYRRVNTWAEDPKNKETMARLEMAKNKNRVADLLEAGYTTEQLDEAEEYLRLYKKMGVGQRLEERVGKTMLGAGKTMLSAALQAGAAGVQTVKNAKASLADEEYRNAVGQQNAALLRMQDLEMSGEAVKHDENGNPAGYTDEYKELQKKLADAQTVMTARDSEINAPVSQDTFGYKLWESGQKDLARSDFGLEESQKFIKGAVTSAAENIALAMINPALVLPGLSAQGAADSFGQSTQNGEAAMTGLAKGVAKGLAGYAINSVGVEQMLDTMGASGTRKTMAANIVQYLKNQSKLSGIAKSNPALYAVLMGATDNGLQSFAETWADYAIDLATNTAEPMSAEQLMMQSLQSMAGGAVGGAATAVAGMGVNAGRRAAYERAQNTQDARNAQMAPENAQNVTENAQAAQNEPAAAADNMKATGDNLPPVQPATDYKNATVTAPAEQTAAATAMRNDIIALKKNLEQGGEIKPRIAQMFLKQGSTEEMKQRKQENRKALAQMLGVEESEIPTTLKAAREYLEWVDPKKLVERTAETQSVQNTARVQDENIANVQSNAENAAAMQQAAPTPPVMRAVPTESMSAEMQQMSREIAEGTGRQVEYFESDNDRVRGAYENGKLYLNKNLNTREAAQQTVVHELTHSQEGTKTYEKMRRYIADSKILEQAAKAATSLNEPPAGMTWAEAWQQKIKEDYEAAGITADPEKEMIAKLCEKYLFYNEDAVNKICRENMSLAETVLDWVREMISRVRGATMEAELRHIERLYRKGIAEAKKNAAQEGGTEYKIVDGEKGRYVQAEDDILNGKDVSVWEDTIKEHINQNIRKGQDIKIRADDGDILTITEDTAWKMGYRNRFKDRSGVYRGMNDSEYAAKIRAASYIDEIASASSRGKANVQDEKVHFFAPDGFNYRTAYYLDTDGKYYKLTVSVGKNGKIKTVYNIGKMETKNPPRDKRSPAESGGKPANAAPVVDSEHSVSQENVPVKDSTTRFSLSDTDSNGNTLTAQQRSYFKDSKIVDEDGNLRVVYHGSSEKFNTFDMNKGRANMDIQGSFFSPWDNDAQGYGENVRAFYLNIKNPAPEGVAYKALNAHKGENNAGVKAREDLIRMGYDGVNNGDEEYIAFYPEQIKLIDNETPTEDKDIRFAVEEKEETVSREEISRGRFARAAKARENGDSMLRALFVEEDIAEETMRVMETIKNESWRILRDTEESQRTAGQKVLDRSANGIAWALKREYHSSADRAGLKEQLIGLYADMEGKNITMEEAIGRARKIGRDLVQTARPERRANTELMDAYGDAYQSLTGQVIRITDSEMQSILHRWGSLREFRRDTGNKIRVSTEDGVPIDALWGELSETNPGKFEADTNDGDRMDVIANFVNEARPQEVQRYAGVEQETAEEIGERIIDGFVDGKVRTEKERVRKEVQKEVRRQVKKGVERLNADNYEYRQELGKEKKKIERMAERMGRKLASPTRQQHIVADADVQRVVQSIADDALAIVTGRFAGEDKLPYVGRKLVALSNSLSHLATTDHRYAGFMTVDADGKDVPVEFVRNLNDLAETMNKIHKENPSISDLDLETARKLRETLERVEHELETADKLLSDTIGAEHRESVEKTAKQIYKEIDGARKVSTNSKSVGAKLLRALDDKNVGYALTILNPMRVARMMTNYSKDSAFVEVVDALNKGQRKMMLLKGQASAIFADVTNSQFALGFDKNARRSKTGLGYTKADYDGFSGRNAQRLDVGFRDADTGEIVYITPAMRAELAMHLMNPHNRDRVLYGGLMVPDAEALCKGKTEEAQRLSHYVRFDISDPAAAYEIVAKVVDGMSDYENQWVKAAQRYFWDFSGKEYNKTTVQLWGYEAANVANYYPAASDDKNLHKNVAQRSQENYTVENNSNLKDRVYDATKPIALNEINRTTLKSIDTMSRFCGLALPMRDFEKIYNYNSEFTASGSSENIKSAMNRAWNGKAGIYWENALEDMNGGRSKRKDALSRFFAKARGNYATAVLYGNASTAMKQAASFPTAAAAIGWKPLADGLANYNKEGAKTLEEINKRVATYSMRNGDGNSVYDTGDTSGAVARLVNSMPGAGWITAADDLTVKVLSTAAKAYVDQNIGNLEKGSTEYWDKVADVYADCIELTQPNNGTMQLSALSRSQNEILRGVTMFSNQRIQNLGLMWDAVADLRAQKARLKDAPNDADAKAEFDRAKEKFANTMSAMAVQSLMIGLMTAAGRALWHREDEYRDELGKITSKSLWKKIADDSLDSFMSNFIGIADIVDVGRFFVDKNYTHYDFAVPELEMINGLVTKGRNMVVAISAALENDDPEKADDLNEKMKKSVLAFAEQAGQSLGVPLVNLRKNVLGIFNGVQGIAEGNGWFGEYQYTAKNVRSMISGYMDGRYDLAGANEMLEKYCVSKYGKAFGDMEKSERDKAASDMREQIAKDWKDLYVQATDEERAELAEKLGDIRVGDRKLFTSKAMQAWVDSAEKTAQEKATKERADRLYSDAVDGLAGQRLYKNMSEDARADLESSMNGTASTAAKLEAGYMKAEDLKGGERYLWNCAGKNADKWLALKAKYAAVNQKAKGGADGTVKMEDFLRALESSGYSTEEQAALLQAKGGNSKLEKAKAETRISYYRAQVYGDTNGNGSLSQSEFKAYVEKSGMKRSVANEIWDMIWTPGKEGSTSPYQ